MGQEIKTISFGVNCYLISAGIGFILVDTNFSSKRKEILQELEKAGCKPGNLKLIIITHGDSDHVGNASYLRTLYHAKIAMHQDDVEMVEKGDMLSGRRDKGSLLLRVVFGLLSLLPVVKLKKSDRFKPDILIDKGFDLSPYGYNGKIIHLPGHSKGSIGVLSSERDLICGDLLLNIKKPDQHFAIPDPEDFQTTIENLKKLHIRTVYPGHGKPFQMDEYLNLKEN